MAALFVTTSASATSTAPPDATCSVRLAPTGGRAEIVRVPANLPAIAVTPGDDVALGAISLSDVDTFSRVTDGVTPGTTLLVLASPLAAGTRHRLQVDARCPAANHVERGDFETTAEVPLPTRVGALAVDGPARYAEAHLALTPTPELEAFLPTTRVEVAVDGATWATTDYGAERAADHVIAIRVGARGGAEGSASLCADGEVGIKRVAIELRAHVAGASSDPEPARLEGVAVDCTRPAYASEASQESSTSGCSAARGGAGVARNNLFAVATIAVSLLIARRRRARP